LTKPLHKCKVGLVNGDLLSDSSSARRDGADSDTRLVSGLQERSAAALAEVYRRHGRAVIEQARRCGYDNAAEDIAQEVFLSLWREPNRYQSSRGSLRTYLMCMTRHRAIDAYRSQEARRRRQDRYAPPETEVSVDDSAVASAEASELRKSLDLLPSPERLAIELAYFGHHTYREVAQLLDQPEGTIKGRIRHGLQTLRSVQRFATASAS
jgi:RNA polymerase sigma-70 factor (ECF subfamily)